jgi:hypothetical protein
MNDQDISKEHRILKAVKLTLTNVIKDTATQPGMKHPLSDATIGDLRNCLVLISEREKELIEDAGGEMNMRPYYTDEPRPRGDAVVPLSSVTVKKKSKK